MKTLILAALLALTGCATTPLPTSAWGTAPADAEGIAKQHLVQRLKDPGSVLWRTVRGPIRIQRGDKALWLMCIEYNAKNSYGGYTGFTVQEVLLNLDGSVWYDNPALVMSECFRRGGAA